MAGWVVGKPITKDDGVFEMARVVFSSKVLPATKAFLATVTAQGNSIGMYLDQMVEREIGREETLAVGAEVRLLARVGLLLRQVQTHGSKADLQAAVDLVLERQSALRRPRRRVTIERAAAEYVAAGNAGGPKTWEQSETYDRESEYEALPDTPEGMNRDDDGSDDPRDAPRANRGAAGLYGLARRRHRDAVPNGGRRR